MLTPFDTMIWRNYPGRTIMKFQQSF